jgi:NAD(P)-dependent dehydrogenase (short-subunit alcohol dehydrogenase family)
MSDNNSALVIGASGGIGTALVQRLLADPSYTSVIGISRSATPPAECSPAECSTAPRLRWLACDGSPAAISATGVAISEAVPQLSRIIICSGILHDAEHGPEKMLEQLDADWMQAVLQANSITPMLWLRAVAAKLTRKQPCRIAVLSARVGSISDNQLGGWYSYRASKAALNMLLKTAAVELARRAPASKLIAFHPGTTDTPLSRPFQSRVPSDKLFTPDFVAERLLKIMHEANADGTLAYLDWDNKLIDW